MTMVILWATGKGANSKVRGIGYLGASLKAYRAGGLNSRRVVNLLTRGQLTESIPREDVYMRGHSI